MRFPDFFVDQPLPWPPGDPQAGSQGKAPTGSPGGALPVLSIEVYPPRTDKGMADLRAILPRLIALGPSYMTVTYGAMGSTQERTLEIAALLKGELGIDTASHLTCVGASAADIDRVLDRLRSSGIENVVALRGDPPRGQDHFVPVEGGFAHANELVAHIRRRGDFGIAVAGYPEKHIEAPDMESDLACLKRKVEAGADIVITQLFFDNRDYFAFVERLRAMGLRAPVMPGILPVQSLSQVEKLTGLCGSKVPAALRARLEAAGEDEEAVGEAGVRWAVEQCRELLERGAPGIHFYVLNRARPMERIVAELRPALGARG
jgi:methylenetetrahydrofolate reductase (NADPH)